MSPTRRHRVAVFIPSLAGGGAEIVCVNLASAFCASGVDAELVVGNASGPLISSLPDDLTLVDLDSRTTVASVVALARYIRRRRPQALISALTHANVTAIAASVLSGTQVRVVCVEHVDLRRQQPDGLRDFVLPGFARLAYPFAHTVAAVSPAVAASVESVLGWRRLSVPVLYNPIPARAIAEAAMAGDAHTWIASPNGTPVVVAVGRLVQQKDFTTLIRALTEVRDVLPVRLVILGEGPLRQQLEDEIIASGLEESVDLPGFIQNPYPTLAGADLLVSSSLWEGLPTAVLEAMTLGVPVVATNCGAGAVELTGAQTGIRLVDVGDHHGMAQAIGDVLTGGPFVGTLPERFDPANASRRYLSICGIEV